MSRPLILVLAAAGAGQAAQFVARPMTSYRYLGGGLAFGVVVSVIELRRTLKRQRC